MARMSARSHPGLSMAALRRAVATLSRERRALVGKALRYPSLYVSAYGVRRRLPDAAPLAEVVDAAERLTWRGGPVKPNQERLEILWLLEVLAQEPPRTVLEIGTLRGGTLLLWTRVATDDAVLVTVDSATALGGLSPLGVLCRSLARGRQRVVPLLGLDSHAAATLGRVERVLHGAPVDFLFIDGDHSYAGVRRDFEMYAPLVRSGGIVAFHDVSQRPTGVTHGVAEFWREFAAAHPTEEFVADEQPGFGIGIYRVP